MNLCEYGCEREGKYKLQNGKWCCNKIWQRCPGFSKKIKNTTTGFKNPMYGRKQSEKTKELISEKLKGRESWNKGKERSEKTKEKIRTKLKGREPWNKGGVVLSLRRTISYLKKKYPFFSQIEEMRYNPDKPGEKEIQVHCKNHNCPNSKEQGGWFTPGNRQIEQRIHCLENEDKDNGYFYCCDECKKECPLYGLQSDPLQNKNIVKQYTREEYDQFREFVLDRDNYICQYCGEPAEHVHHERPQKLEPFFSLDPDYAWSCCKKCHYEKGHKKGTDCSTKRLSNIVCF